MAYRSVAGLCSGPRGRPDALDLDVNSGRDLFQQQESDRATSGLFCARIGRPSQYFRFRDQS